MDFGGFWIYVVLEALAITGVLAIYLAWKNRNLNAQLASADGQKSSQALDVESYSDLVNKEILNTEAKLAHLADQPDTPAGLAETVQARLTFLIAEREAAGDSSSEEEKFWSRMMELLPGRVPAPDDPEVDASAAEDQSSLVEALQTRIQAYETRVANLEQFKQLFFEIKLKQVNSKGLEDRIRTEVEKVIPEQDQTPELRVVLSTLREENHTLEEQLNHIEQELDDVLRAAGPVGIPQTETSQVAVSSMSGGLEDDVENIRRVISQYKNHINDLNGLVMNLKLDVKDKEQLETYTEELKSQSADLQAAMHHLEEENDFLQEQISALLKQELEKEKQIKADAVEVENKLEAQLTAYAELEGKYAEMEQSYLVAYQENQKLIAAAGSR